MAHFPQLQAKVRAPRVRVPNGEPINFHVDNRRITAVVHQLSTTGGVAVTDKRITPGTLGEVTLNTISGPVSGLVEFLELQKDGVQTMLPFRFVALNDEDHVRLEATLQVMRRRQTGY